VSTAGIRSILGIFDTRALRVVFTVLAVVVVLVFAYAARRMLTLFLFSIFFAYLIDPLISRVEPWVKGRGRAIAVVYLGGLIALGVLGWLIGGRAIGETQHLIVSLPVLYQKLVSGEIAWTLGAQRGWSYETIVKVQAFLAAHSGQIVAYLQGVGTRIASLAKYGWWVVLVPILGAFFLRDGRAMIDAVIDLASRRRNREFLNAVVEDVNVMLAQFIRAQLILAALSGMVYTIALLVLRVPYGLVLGPIGGMLEFLPVVGPLTAALGICGIAVASGYQHIIVLVAFLGVWRLIQDYVVAPRIMGKQVELHPLAALFGILVGAEVGGVVGVYLSIPLMATLRIVFRNWRRYMERPQPQIVAPAPVVPEEHAA
jgi:predicted PurR-regulated permease PerM